MLSPLALWGVLLSVQVCGSHDVPILERRGGDLLVQENKAPFTMKLTINIGLLGFSESKLPTNTFLNSLITSLSSVRPRCLETEDALHFQYELDYNVKHFPEREVRYFHNKLNEEFLFATYSEDGHVIYDINVNAKMKGTVNTLLLKMFNPDGSEDTGIEPHSILIVNPDKFEMKPRDYRKRMKQIPNYDPKWLDPKAKKMRYSYRYRHYNGPPTQSYMTSQRCLFIDLSAGPVRYGMLKEGPEILGQLAPHGGLEGTVSEYSFPNFRRDYLQTSQRSVSILESRAHLVSVVVSAIRHVFAPDIMHKEIEYGNQIIIPVVHVKSDRGQDEDLTKDLGYLEKQTRKMLLSNQELTMPLLTISIKDYGQIDEAVNLALTESTIDIYGDNGTLTQDNEVYLDSKILLNELKTHEDQTGGLQTLGIADKIQALRASNLLAGELGAETHGTRVIPIYVFSLNDLPGGILLDKQSFVVSSAHAVVVLRSHDAVELPYFADEKPIYISAQETVKNILEGIATTYGGLTPPYVRFSPEKKILTYDFKWAMGHHPFGPFTNTSKISRLMLDISTRNAIAARVSDAWSTVQTAIGEIVDFSKKYVFEGPLYEDEAHAMETSSSDDSHNKILEMLSDQPKSLSKAYIPANTVQGLLTQLTSIREQFGEIRDHLENFRFEDANQMSASVILVSKSFLTYCRDELAEAKEEITACKVSYWAEPPYRPYSVRKFLKFSFYSILILVGVFLFKRFVLTSKDSKTRDSVSVDTYYEQSASDLRRRRRNEPLVV